MNESILLLTPKKWDEFQHYKDRLPPWIKLHRELLNNKDFMRLPTASKALAPLLWLLASESREKNGAFNASTDELEFRLRMSVKDIETGRKALIHAGFFIVASAVLAPCLQVATPETETEREERERTEREEEERRVVAGTFEQFYSAYPNKSGKKTAAAAFEKAAIENLSIVLADIEFRLSCDDWRKEGGKYIPMPATYLNQRRWEDERNAWVPSPSKNGNEPAWRTEQRKRTLAAVPSIADTGTTHNDFFDVEARNVAAISLG